MTIGGACTASNRLDRTGYAAYYKTGDGTPRDVVNKVRPVLETYFRNLYPGEFAADALGTIIRKVRENGPAHLRADASNAARK